MNHNQGPKKLFYLSLAGYFLTLTLYSIFSYSLTAPNLVLSQNPLFWDFQSLMWKTFFNQREVLTITYISLMTGIFASFGGLIYSLRKTTLTFKKTFLILGLLILPLLFSNNALSYDVFNYIFNAKMVVVYQADPHLQVALDFADDPWTRFMHNTHTSAPYGYGWTFLSLIPFTLGMGKFITTWLSFRLFSLLPLLVLAWFYLKKVRPDQRNLIYLVIFNPLVLLEVISNFHNDLWMMVPALIALQLTAPISLKPRAVAKNLAIPLVIAATAWIKLASILLFPIFILRLLRAQLKDIPRLSLVADNWALLGSLLVFAPLLTARSQQFHPWYLTWPLVFIPFMRPNKLGRIWTTALVTLSCSSMFRYLPFLWNNNYEGNVLAIARTITFAPLLMVVFLILRHWRKK